LKRGNRPRKMIEKLLTSTGPSIYVVKLCNIFMSLIRDYAKGSTL
jgi:hypothetical protein